MPHIHEKIDFTVAAYIVYEREVLLIHHRGLGKWLPVGGHIELDEDPEQALFREIEEESGITRDRLEPYLKKPEIISSGTKFLFPPVYLDNHSISDEHRHIGMVYFLLSSTNRIRLAEQEHLNIKWFAEEELDDREYDLIPEVRYYASKALEAFQNN